MYRLVAAVGCLLLSCCVVSGGLLDFLGRGRQNAPRQFRATRFSWEMCTSSAEPLAEVQSIDMTEPVLVPGQNNVKVVMNIKEDLDTKLRVKLRIAKVTLWGLLEVPIPCIANVGSCTYEDLCPMMAEYYEENGHCPGNIPEDIIPCRCPVEKTNGFQDYDFPFEIEPDSISSLLAWLASGKYTVKVEASTNGREIGCLQAELDVAQG